MAEVIMTKKQQRIRCSDEKFLEAIYSSNAYAEIAEKTGQKLSSTMARYSRTKKLLKDRGIDIPQMQKNKSHSTADSVDKMVEIVQRLKAHHSES